MDISVNICIFILTEDQRMETSAKAGGGEDAEVGPLLTV